MPLPPADVLTGSPGGRATGHSRPRLSAVVADRQLKAQRAHDRALGFLAAGHPVEDSELRAAARADGRRRTDPRGIARRALAARYPDELAALLRRERVALGLPAERWARV